MPAEKEPANRRGLLIPGLFALTLFTGSALLFLVQPLCAKMVLPLLGGSPGVWNTCMVFFQAGLLGGYAYAHAGPPTLGIRLHGVVHLGLLASPLLLLPIALGKQAPDPEAWPAWWLLQTLVISAGLPLVMLASNAPLLQRWFASSSHERAGDPYFLYAASNLGSMAALLAYPFVVEPNLTLSRQSVLWTVGYGGLVLLTAVCGVAVWPSFRFLILDFGFHVANSESKIKNQKSKIKNRLSWLLLALVPSSLLLSVTTFLSTDVAAIPLFWVVPLALYLLTFVLAFAAKAVLAHALVLRWLPLAVLLLVLIKLAEATEPVPLVFGVELAGLFWICLACHGELARRRPAAEHLTEYYLWLALGGVLGGAFNALLAPLIFPAITEYPLMLVAACLLLPRRVAGGGAGSVYVSPPQGTLRARNVNIPTPFDFLLPALLGLGTAGLILLGQQLALPPGPISVAVMFMVPVVVAYTFLERPVRFGLGIAAILLASVLYPGVHGHAIYRARSFFGVHQVTEGDGLRRLIHGNTVHGLQSLDPATRRTPLAYYHPHGPIGRLFQVLKNDPRLKRVALIGLGTGALASYSQPAQHWTFFEIDPEVIRIAGPDAELFTFVREARDAHATIDVVTGDGRLMLARSPDRFGLIVIDAFNSDSIPVHLLTREALAIYRSRLTPDGILAAHISNRYLDLEPVLANLARDANPSMQCLVRNDGSIPESDKLSGRMPAQWVVLANSAADLNVVRRGRFPWYSPRVNPALRVWTDDFSNLFQVFKWHEP